MPLNSQIGQLIIKHLQEKITTDEAQTLQQWIAASEKNKILFDKLSNSDSLQQAVNDHAESDARIKERVFAELPEMQDPSTESPKRGWIRWMSVAAAVLIIVSIGWYVWQGKTKPEIVAEHQTPVATVIPAGGNKATLTLADGTVIDLDKAGNGTIATEGKTTVNKKEDGQLEYKSATSTKQAVNTYNMLTTPRGGQYQLILPDGSKVWLNAASSIKYPTAFAGNERRVEITGEAYFEITPSTRVVANGEKEKRPFIVSVNGMEVEVLGTHFNINSYTDEPAMKTTLLEGKVKTRSVATNEQTILEPGEQVQISAQTKALKKNKDVDVDAEVAWRFGYFQFANTDVRTVMRQLERWYDVEVQYSGEVPDREFVGIIPRSLNLSKVLNLLQKQNVHFKIDGKKIIVAP